MTKKEFRTLYEEQEARVKEEGKTGSGWLMGYVQGLGNRKLSGYQFAALVDLFLVHPDEAPVEPDASSPVPEAPVLRPVVGKVDLSRR